VPKFTLCLVTSATVVGRSSSNHIIQCIEGVEEMLEKLQNKQLIKKLLFDFLTKS